MVPGLPSVSASAIDVIGRHWRKVYFAFHTAMPASAIAIFTKANKRAFWERVVPRSRPKDTASRFQNQLALLAVPQNRAAFVWSVVREGLLERPSRCTSFRSA